MNRTKNTPKDKHIRFIKKLGKKMFGGKAGINRMDRETTGIDDMRRKEPDGNRADKNRADMGRLDRNMPDEPRIMEMDEEVLERMKKQLEEFFGGEDAEGM